MLMGRPAGTPCREGNEVPKDAEGTGDARRAIEACLLSGAGDVDRMDEVEIGTDRDGSSDEPSPLSVIVAVSRSQGIPRLKRRYTQEHEETIRRDFLRAYDQGCSYKQV